MSVHLCPNVQSLTHPSYSPFILLNEGFVMDLSCPKPPQLISRSITGDEEKGEEEPVSRLQ